MYMLEKDKRILYMLQKKRRLENYLNKLLSIRDTMRPSQMKAIRAKIKETFTTLERLDMDDAINKANNLDKSGSNRDSAYNQLYTTQSNVINSQSKSLNDQENNLKDTLTNFYSERDTLLTRQQQLNLSIEKNKYSQKIIYTIIAIIIVLIILMLIMYKRS